MDFAEPNFLQLTLELAEVTPPVTADTHAAVASAGDPGFASQWGLEKIRAPEAWGVSSGNPSVAVAVPDEGCDVSHEDLSYRLPPRVGPCARAPVTTFV